MICLAVTYAFKAGDEAEAVEHLRKLAEGAHEEPGNLMFIVHRVQEDARTFFIYEQYADKAALDAHWASPHFAEHGLNGIRKLAETRVGLVCEPLT